MSDEEFSIYSTDLILLLREVLGKGAVLRFQARGISMTPFIKNGDIITVSPLEGCCKTGDVVAFINPAVGKLFVHRITGHINGSYIIQGDNFMQSDGTFPEDTILGYVKKIERNGKNISFGLGPEKIFIAFLSRYGLLVRMVSLFRKITPSFFRRIIL